ncbi:MAG: Hsp33 family molecular chaperone HslO [Bacillota bacterium]
MVQLLPGTDEEMAARLEGNLGKLGHVSRLINAGSSAEDLLRAGLEGVDCRVLDRMELRFRCHCDRDRAADLLVSLGREELAELAESAEPTEMRCHFCNEVYRFTPEEVRSLMDKAVPGGDGRGPAPEG